MVTRYPAAIDNNQTLPSVVNSTAFSPASINILRDAIIAVETQLGVLPAGIYGTVKNRLDNIDSTINSIIGGGGGGIIIGGDLGGTVSHALVIGLQGRPVASTVPADGYALIWNGSAWEPGSDFGNQIIQTTGGVIGGPAIFGSIATQLFDLSGKQIFNAISSTNVSDTGQAIIYYDTTANNLLLSANGGGYIGFPVADPNKTSKDCTAGGTITLSAAEIAHERYILTGSPGAAFTVVIGTGAGDSWHRPLLNNTSKNATISAGGGDAGTVVLAGQALLLLHTGTNIVMVSS